MRFSMGGLNVVLLVLLALSPAQSLPTIGLPDAGLPLPTLLFSNPTLVPAFGPFVKWQGRYVPLVPSGGVTFDWAGVSATVTVTNNFTALYATILDNSPGGNKLNVYMQGQGLGSMEQRIASFFTGPGLANYTLFSSPLHLSFSGTAATFRVEKAVEARFTQGSGATNLTLLSFTVESGVFLPPPPPSPRTMEFIGDSITSGDLVYCQDSWGRHVGEANALWADDVGVSYHALLCQYLGADCSTVSWGGMGLVVNDVPQWVWPTMPDVYHSALAWQVSVDGQAAEGHLRYPWNFSSFIPRVVVVNLGTNDAWSLRNASGAQRFTDRMVAFVRNITGLYTSSSSSSSSSSSPPGHPPKVFLAFGPMTSAYEAPLVEAVGVLNGGAGGGLNVSLLNMTLDAGNCACGHPSAQDHATIAHKVVGNISAAMGWGVEG